MKKILLFLAGLVCIVLGITLVLREWCALTIVFKGISGAILAIVGLVILCALKE